MVHDFTFKTVQMKRNDTNFWREEKLKPDRRSTSQTSFRVNPKTNYSIVSTTVRLYSALALARVIICLLLLVNRIHGKKPRRLEKPIPVLNSSSMSQYLGCYRHCFPRRRHHHNSQAQFHRNRCPMQHHPASPSCQTP